MKLKKIEYSQTLKLSYYKEESFKGGQEIIWWISPVNFAESLSIQTNYNSDIQRYEVEIIWNKTALKKLWALLINMSNFNSVDPNYHFHVDEFDNILGNTNLMLKKSRD